MRYIHVLYKFDYHHVIDNTHQLFMIVGLGIRLKLMSVRLVHDSGAIPPLVKTRELNEDFSISITPWLYFLISLPFHVVARDV